MDIYRRSLHAKSSEGKRRHAYEGISFFSPYYVHTYIDQWEGPLVTVISPNIQKIRLFSAGDS